MLLLQYTTVVFIPYTNESELKKRLQNVEKEGAQNRNFIVKFVEKGGQQLGGIVCNTEKKEKDCLRHDCFPCQNPDNKGRCGEEGPCYDGTCIECKMNGPTTWPEIDMDGKVTISCLQDGDPRKKPTISKYRGESGRTAYTRGLEHSSQLINKDKNSPFWRHCQLYHNSKVVKFTMEITSTHM